MKYFRTAIEETIPSDIFLAVYVRIKKQGSHFNDPRSYQRWFAKGS